MCKAVRHDSLLRQPFKPIIPDGSSGVQPLFNIASLQDIVDIIGPPRPDTDKTVRL